MGDSQPGIRKLGPSLSGALFGAGWWVWVDAVTCAGKSVGFLHYLPGIGATLAAFMFNLIRKEDLTEYSPFDDGAGNRSKAWLFAAYVLSFASLAFATSNLIQDVQGGAPYWLGTAGVLQGAFILASGLVYWCTRSSSNSGIYM